RDAEVYQIRPKVAGFSDSPPELVGRFGSAPAILKAALDARGLPGGPVRPPLRDVVHDDRARIAATLQKLGVS
ncbi:MAG: hypothetical protein JJU40_14820, partial [Rhodobacteraceae bacterium]|nr:hypothetical protein [Paracoccaceae bacterium]